MAILSVLIQALAMLYKVRWREREAIWVGVWEYYLAFSLVMVG